MRGDEGSTRSDELWHANIRSRLTMAVSAAAALDSSRSARNDVVAVIIAESILSQVFKMASYVMTDASLEAAIVGWRLDAELRR
jgi:hypothetical protein